MSIVALNGDNLGDKNKNAGFILAGLSTGVFCRSMFNAEGAARFDRSNKTRSAVSCLAKLARPPVL